MTPQPEQTTPGRRPPPMVTEMARFALEMAIPLAWHDAMKPFPKKVTVASCFAMKFRERLIGVTAAHVLREYQADRHQNPEVKCQLSSLPFDLEEAVIDHDDDLDLATFALSEAQLGAIKRGAFGCQEIWPPPTPERQIQVSLAGYPNYLFATDAEGGVLPKAVYAAVTLVEDISDHEIILTYDPATARADPDIPMPPFGREFKRLQRRPAHPYCMHRRSALARLSSWRDRSWPEKRMFSARLWPFKRHSRQRLSTC